MPKFKQTRSNHLKSSDISYGQTSALANRFDFKANRFQLIPVEQISTVEQESWFPHGRVNRFKVSRLKFVPSDQHSNRMNTVRSLLTAASNFNVVVDQVAVEIAISSRNPSFVDVNDANFNVRTLLGNTILTPSQICLCVALVVFYWAGEVRIDLDVIDPIQIRVSERDVQELGDQMWFPVGNHIEWSTCNTAQTFKAVFGRNERCV